MGKLLGSITQPNFLSRHAELCIADDMLIDGTVHAGDKIPAGSLMVQASIGGGNSKWVAYAEGVLNSAMTTSSLAFSVDPAQLPRASQWFRPGMKISTISGTALGTVATFNPVTGVGSLAANSAAAVASGQGIKLDPAVYLVAYGVARILSEEVLLDSGDDVISGYFKGYFTQAATSVTANAQAALGSSAVVINSALGELEIK